MPKINPYNLHRPSSKPIVFTVTDVTNPGVEVEFTLKEPDIQLGLKISKSVTAYTNRYLLPDPKFGECLSLPPIEGETLELDEDLVELICTIMGLQGGPKEDQYSFEEIAALIVTMPTGMLQVINKAGELAGKFQELLENPFPAAIIVSSESTVKSTEDIQN